MERWAGARRHGRILKTDLFEEANGADHVLLDLAAGSGRAYGVDLAPDTAGRACMRFGSQGVRAAVADVRELPFQPGTFDLIVSTSTLDHFQTPGQIERALHELNRTLAPGGRMIITLDNPWNPLYWPLRLSSSRVGPFALGRTMSRRRLAAELEGMGLEVVGRDYLIHNPRLVSTLLFLTLRRLLGRRADAPIRVLMQLFAVGARLPFQCFTGAFLAVCAEKRGSDLPLEGRRPARL